MKPSLVEKLEGTAERVTELEQLLADPRATEDPQRRVELAREYSEKKEIAEAFQRYKDAVDAITAAEKMLGEEEDAGMRELAREEVADATRSRDALTAALMTQLLPRDPDDHRNVFLEIRAGTGGDEAALFAGDLFRMYTRLAERHRWQVSIISESPGEHGGFKEIIARVAGTNVFARLKYESGIHRVQRVPATESQGRIHTSACTVAVLPEVEAVDEITIDPTELRIDTYRSSGAGGQHVNTTDSAVRITHLPTNTVVECQDERSQHKNKARAMSLLQARLLQNERERQAEEIAKDRTQQVGSGDRSGKIRTYNFPQGRVTDHRINLTLHKLDSVLDGQVDEVIDALSSERQAEQLAALAD